MTAVTGLLIALLLVFALPANLAFSQERPPASAGPGRAARPTTLEERVESPRPGPSAVRLSDAFTLKALVGIDLEYERNLDLDRSERENVTLAEPILRLSGTYRPSERFFAFSEVEFPVAIERSQDSGSRTDISVNVNQVYLSFAVTENLTLRVGRQLFRDDREWLFDEDLDGVRLIYRWSDLRIDASATRRSLVRRNLRDRKSVGEPTNNYALLARYELFDDFEIGGYAILRDRRVGEEGRPLFLGLSTRGEVLSDNLEHWLELATVQGRDDERRRLNGYAVDVGATYSFKAPLRPRLTLGYAWGSGDSSSKKGANRAYRQTGLQSNDGRFGGIAKFKYYGEALDPELSNLHILTAGIGFSPRENVSVDLVYHGYWQDRLARELRDAAVDLDPNEDRRRPSRDIGQGLDLVVGVRVKEAVELEIAAGYFRPGRAFRVEKNNRFRKADDALFLRLELEILF